MRTSLRVAGWGTLGFAIAFFATFAVNQLMFRLFPFPDHPLAADMAGDHYNAIVGTTMWSIAGVGLGVAALGLADAAHPRGTYAQRLCALFGSVATAGWMLAGAAIFAQRSPLLNGNIAAEHAGRAAEGAVVEGLFVLVHAGGVLFGVAAVPWLAIAAAGIGRRVSKTAAGFLWVAAFATFAGFVVTGAQFGFLLVMICFAVVGPILLRRAKRMPDASADAATRAPVESTSAPA